MFLMAKLSLISFSSRRVPSSARATRSSPPPGLPAGTISIVLAGYCAACSAALTQVIPAATMRSRASFMLFLRLDRASCQEGRLRSAGILYFARDGSGVAEARHVDRVRARPARNHDPDVFGPRSNRQHRVGPDAAQFVAAGSLHPQEILVGHPPRRHL